MSEAMSAVTSNVEPLTDTQYFILLGLGSVSCAFSWFGSLSIIYIARRKLYFNVYHRLLFMVSCIDFLSTVVGIWNPFLTNAETGYKLAHGNQATCTFVGFVIMFAATSKAIYTFYITLYFMLSVRYSWTDKHITQYESYAYLAAFAVPLLYGIAGVINEAFNPNEFRFCGIAKYPIGCVDNECIRGDIARKSTLTKLMNNNLSAKGTIINLILPKFPLLWLQQFYQLLLPAPYYC
jgi:hypothetical protein